MATIDSDHPLQQILYANFILFTKIGKCQAFDNSTAEELVALGLLDMSSEQDQVKKLMWPPIPSRWTLCCMAVISRWHIGMLVTYLLQKGAEMPATI